jgi:ABC-2 type transport system ATP-binding protein
MSDTAMVRVEHAEKAFFTRHFFSKDEKTGKRRFHEKRRVDAVRGVDFGVERGEIFGLLGPNGAGKTTLVKMLSGLVRPSGGKVYVDGLHVEKKRLQVLRRVGAVFEGTRTCIWPLTPLENLAYFGNLKNVKGSVLKKRSHELLDFIGLKDKKDVQVRRLSRGQKQKLAICIALIADPSVILLDEPTTGLDVQSARSIKDKIIEMTREQNKTVLVTTHDMGVAQELCDRIGIINKGELITCKPTGELLDLFTEQVYEFRLDQIPAPDLLEGIPGVLEHHRTEEESGPMCTVTIENDPDQLSEAIYVVIELFRANGLKIRSVEHQKQNLENVFLRLTAGS